MVHNRQSERCNSALSISVNTVLVNKVVNDTSVKPQKTLNYSSVTTPSLVKQSHNDTVSTRNRFQVLYDLHADNEGVSLQNELQNKSNSVTVSPRNTFISTKVRKMCNLTKINKGREQKSDTKNSVAKVSTTVQYPNNTHGFTASDKTDDDFLVNPCQHEFIGSTSEPMNCHTALKT